MIFCHIIECKNIIPEILLVGDIHLEAFPGMVFCSSAYVKIHNPSLNNKRLVDQIKTLSAQCATAPSKTLDRVT